MRCLLALPFTLLLLFASCSSSTPEEQARTGAMVAAQSGYDRLLSGDYSGFIACREGMADIPSSFREQMIDTYKMYIASEQKVHGGISRATATRAVMDSTLNIMQVFMLLSYGNGSQEEIVVPMVYSDGEWKMR